MNVDKWLDRTYNAESYNCGHFIQEVYEEITNVDLSEIKKAFMSSNVEWYRQELKFRKRLKFPETPCLVLLHGSNVIPHVGIFIDDKFLHITENGVRYEPLSNFEGVKFSFYK